ncbi:MAG: YicC family protein [Lachnospiraceae bacterium]|nr:YicC family protein [Lachnospiraceae bacterium]
MIKSMTGFGRCEVADGSRRIVVEIKSVNHRYLDVAIKIPKKLTLFENTIRSLLKEYAQRGKVDVFITYEDCVENQVQLRYNEALAGEYVKYMQQMAEHFGLALDLTASSLARYPEVLTMEAQELDEKEWWQLLEQAIRGAAEKFVEARTREGGQLCEDLLGKLDVMTGYVDQIEARSPEIVAEYRRKLTAKIQELLADAQAEESRVLTEVTLFAERICTDEETVRLKTHISSMRETLKKGENIGRKLDFIAQEMNREANTILSKANDMEVAEIAVNLKTDVEKIREQIQNIE